jgi:serine O-acetyltransferase
VVVGGGAKILGNIIVGKNCRIGAGSVVPRNVPDDSTVVGVPGHIIFRQGKRVVITDPKQINDPLSEALAAVATEVHKLRERVKTLEDRKKRASHPRNRCSVSWTTSTTRFSRRAV